MKITKEHIKLLNNMDIRWNSSGFGSPMVNPARPYLIEDEYETNIEDVAEICYPISETEELKKLHYQTLDVIKYLFKNCDKIIGHEIKEETIYNSKEKIITIKHDLAGYYLKLFYPKTYDKTELFISSEDELKLILKTVHNIDYDK